VPRVLVSAGARSGAFSASPRRTAGPRGYALPVGCARHTRPPARSRAPLPWAALRERNGRAEQVHGPASVC